MTAVERVHPRLSLNQATIKRAGLREALRVCADAGIGSIGLWREPVAELGLAAACRLIGESGLRVSSLCRGGFFTDDEPGRRRDALEDNRRAIEEVAALADAAAPGSRAVLVLVAGGLPTGSRDLPGARRRVRDAIGELEAFASSAGVVLALEALHPMYVADRAVISTLSQALDIAEEFDCESVGVVVDTFHLWWDPDLTQQIARAGRGRRIASYQVSDWATPLPGDVLLARAMMGLGHIDFGPISLAVDDAGYTGDVEVEIFNEDIWNADPVEVVCQTVRSFQTCGVRG